MLIKWKDLSIIGALVLSFVSASAHHSFQSEFDADKPVKLRGAIIKVELINPHAWIHINVKGDNGETVEWMIEAGSPNSLIRRGVSKNSIPIGTEVIVEGYHAKDGTNKANGKLIALPDGRRYLLGANVEDASPDPQK
jgi:hypothetical protein